MPTPIKNLGNMSKHLTKDEIEARESREAAVMPSRIPKKPKLILQDKVAKKHWSRLLAAMKGLEIIDVLDTDVLSIYCAKLARRDNLQTAYLQQLAHYEASQDIQILKITISLSVELQSIERDLLAYASKLGLTPESRARLAKRMAEQEVFEPDADLFA